MNSLLDNIIWQALSGPQSVYSAGTHASRRYALGFSPIVGFADPERPDFDALRPYCMSDEHFYCAGWSGAAPAGRRIDAETTMYRMLWNADTTPENDVLEAITLGPEHAQQALDLATLPKPGPFGLRTLELGEYFGCFDSHRLIGMAGERMFAGSLREISGVCTHPDFQGRGLARRLMIKLIHRQMARKETPFLHVMRENRGAHQLYERMGFHTYCETVVRVVSPC